MAWAISPARSLASRTMEKLLGGPSSALTGAAISVIPKTARLRSNLVPGPNGQVLIDLTELGDLDDGQAVGIEILGELCLLGDLLRRDLQHLYGALAKLLERCVAVHNLLLCRRFLERYRPMPRPPSTGTTAPVT